MWEIIYGVFREAFSKINVADTNFTYKLGVMLEQERAFILLTPNIQP